MILRTGIKDPQRLMAIGLMCMVVAILLRMLFEPACRLAMELRHGISGFLLGLSIVFNLRSAVWMGRQRRIGNAS